jgi:conjugal transfer pilin signal peptidase TrbI
LTRGDYVVFVPRQSKLSAQFKGIQFFKRIEGVAGDAVQREFRNIAVNGRGVGFAITHTSSGQPLNPIDPQTIPAGMFYVRGDHVESFDSRYQECGLVGRDQVIGKAHVLF